MGVCEAPFSQPGCRKGRRKGTHDRTTTTWCWTDPTDRVSPHSDSRKASLERSFETFHAVGHLFLGDAERWDEPHRLKHRGCQQQQIEIEAGLADRGGRPGEDICIKLDADHQSEPPHIPDWVPTTGCDLLQQALHALALHGRVGDEAFIVHHLQGGERRRAGDGVAGVGPPHRPRGLGVGELGSRGNRRQRHPGRQALGHHQNVGGGAVVAVGRKEVPGAAKPRLNFVDNQEHPRLAAERRHGLQKLGWERHVPALAQDGFDQNGARFGRGALLAEQQVEVGECPLSARCFANVRVQGVRIRRHVHPRHERPEAFPVHRL
eukprot:m.187203 g.187203  ORF g.187203 m.187203 type:complete len:321 (-) comp24788_c0_seq1:512-1474(-)